MVFHCVVHLTCYSEEQYKEDFSLFKLLIRPDDSLLYACLKRVCALASLHLSVYASEGHNGRLFKNKEMVCRMTSFFFFF